MIRAKSLVIKKSGKVLCGKNNCGFYKNTLSGNRLDALLATGFLPGKYRVVYEINYCIARGNVK